MSAMDDFLREDGRAGLKKWAILAIAAALVATAVVLCAGLWGMMDEWFTFEKNKEAKLGELSDLEKQRETQSERLKAQQASTAEKVK